jgi:cytochrome P450
MGVDATALGAVNGPPLTSVAFDTKTIVDVFDVNREQRAHLGFSVGAHYCLGSSLARLEGRVALEEILLKRFPAWEVDLPNAVFSTTSTIRGWDSMPAFVG